MIFLHCCAGAAARYTGGRVALRAARRCCYPGAAALRSRASSQNFPGASSTTKLIIGKAQLLYSNLPCDLDTPPPRALHIEQDSYIVTYE